jgi:hypothetical protein
MLCHDLWKVKIVVIVDIFDVLHKDWGEKSVGKSLQRWRRKDHCPVKILE